MCSTCTARIVRLLVAMVAATTLVSAADTQPKLLNAVRPKHPPELFEHAIEGEAKVRFLIGETGGVSEVEVIETSDPAFGEAAVEAVRQWTFEPATTSGQPVAVYAEQVLRFAVPTDKKLEVLAGRKVIIADPQPLVEETALKRKPKLLQPIRPPYPSRLRGSGTQGEVTLRFVISPEGLAMNPQIVTASDRDFAFPALRALLAAKWEPVKQGRAPVYVQATTTLKFREEPPRPAGGERAPRGEGMDFGGGGGGFPRGGGGDSGGDDGG